jgi:hypothetical protein
MRSARQVLINIPQDNLVYDHKFSKTQLDLPRKKQEGEGEVDIWNRPFLKLNGLMRFRVLARLLNPYRPSGS